MAREPEKHEKAEDRAGPPRQESPQEPGLPEGAIEVGPGVISIRSGQDPAAHGAGGASGSGGRSPGSAPPTTALGGGSSGPASPGHRER